MDNSLKKNIRLLSEKYNHKISYYAHYFELVNEVNQIKITSKNKDVVEIEYNLTLGNTTLLIVLDEIYDIIIELLSRTHLYQLKIKTGKLLNISDWLNDSSVMSLQKFAEQISTLKKESIDYKNLGGDRFEAEYYKGLIILVDDICWEKSNVIEIESLLN